MPAHLLEGNALLNGVGNNGSRKWTGRVVGVLIIAALLGATACSPRTARKPDRSGPGGTPGGKLEVLAFYDDEHEKEKGDVLDLVERYREEVTYLSPFWYLVRPDGTVMDESQRSLKDFARRNRIKLQPLFTNAQGNDIVLTNPAARSRAVKNIVDIVGREGYAGASIDFQLLEPGSRDGLTAFMKELYGQLRPKGKIVTVNVIPFLQEESEHEPYDYAALARNSHRIILMTYDRHGMTSKPGPVAPMDWVEKVTRFAVRRAGNPDKVILGLAAYGYDWPAGTGQPATTMPMKRIGENVLRARAGEERARIEREPDKTAHYTYTKNGARHEVWFEDDESIVPKIQLAKRLNLHGVAIWRVGYEDKDYWESVKRNR